MQLLSQEILLQEVDFHPLSLFLSIYQYFSLGFLCQPFHKKPQEVAG